MELLIFIIVLGLIFFQEVQKKLTSASTSSPKNTLSDNFPVFTYEEEKSTNSTSTKKPTTVSNKRHVKNKVNAYKAKKQAPASPLQTAKTTDSNTSLKGYRLNLHNRTEARKAFLYAEIFHRKYE